MDDQEALAVLMTSLEIIAAKALAGFKDEMDPDQALSDINNLARDTIDAMAKRRVS